MTVYGTVLVHSLSL